MAKAPLKSIHPLDMADALTAQNEAVASLLATCGAVIALGGMSETAKKTLQSAVDGTRAVFWGSEFWGSENT